MCKERETYLKTVLTFFAFRNLSESQRKKLRTTNIGILKP